ncbi:MAG: family 20 glycosylhydrolase [Bryobacteraceae bacterium]|jgi:hexosaminidase
MRSRFVAFPVWLPALALSAFGATPALMPLPVKMEPGAGALAIDTHFTAAATGAADPRLVEAIDRLVRMLSRETGIAFAGRGASAGAATLQVECAARAPLYPKLGEDESYQLDVTAEGAHLKAATVDGALRGLATVAQLAMPGPHGFEIPAVHIEDRPRFPWRGLMLDVSRHWMPLEVVLRNLEAMAAVKLNVFHWHLSDDQGFRVESRLFPRLEGKGSDGRFYTQVEIRRVVAFARDRGIRVIPEFDMPGHSTSWFAGYPALASAPGPYQAGHDFGVFDAAMDPTREDTYKFLDAFIGEMSLLFPDPFFHIGGDEVNGRQWKESAHVQAFARAHKLTQTHELQLYFNHRLQRILARHGKTMVGWDEILQPDLAKGTVIQSWRGQASLAESAAKGYRGILSWGYYLDHLRPAKFHYEVDPLAGAAAELAPEVADRILGGEACMWTELADSENVDSRIWPRTAAIAERFWSPQTVTDAASMYDRMETVSRLLAWTGVEHRAVYGPMLGRLTGGRPAPSLQVLAEASEALGLGKRSPRKNETGTPLNRFVDAIPAESEAVRALELAAVRVASGSGASQSDLDLLRGTFERWAANDAPFEALLDDNALLGELQPLSQRLAALGRAGLEALDDLAHDRKATRDWLAARNAEIADFLKPAADVTLAAARPVKLLLDAQALAPE